ncbi:FixH family protein [Bacillus methanolicus]|uniref:YtkA-like domain-containing protein n=1 Tax=Bacillus methanolicus (strain MGA3 / ATCC 53907) TaxID=796606 RepID=I3E9I1_BACMM|nr:FixH family protein [Bacillus methanolicus]AIE60400.1 hypothetical protein BMMGA3_10020 [Bacillus methanolicus MGA3]EIJ83152.1 hypothetical protein MGA3_08020 [Bacillus methanolicus MGA3]UQD52421.1 hypothetical protein C0971_10680 [Bacillus methanolicus]
MKKAVLIFSIICAFVLAGCSNNQEKAQETPKFLDVKLTVNPEKAKVNQPVTFEAKVTYGKEAVTDADDVKFEIWRANDKNHEKIQVKHAENGIYRLKKSFNREGTYYIISHVTARNMHNMPKAEFVIGHPSEPEKDSNQSMNMEMDHDTNQGESHNHGH